MKKVTTIIIPMLMVLFFSCENNNEETFNTNENTNALRFEENIDYLENNMQVVSFITARILFDDDTNLVRTQFNSALISQLGSPSKVVQLNNLLGDLVTNSAFKDAFEAEYANHLVRIPTCPGSAKPNVTCPTCRTNVTFADFKNYLLEDNCIELYLPNGYNTNYNAEFNTTAHPLNASGINNGYKTPHPCDDEDSTSVNEFSDANFNSYNNLIVARPYRQNRDCEYNNYGSFTDFLSN